LPFSNLHLLGFEQYAYPTIRFHLRVAFYLYLIMFNNRLSPLQKAISSFQRLSTSFDQSQGVDVLPSFHIFVLGHKSYKKREVVWVAFHHQRTTIELV